MANTKLSAIEPELKPESAKSSSERSFGIVFAGAFTVFGTWPLLGGHSPKPWPLIVACVFGLAAAYVPWTLRPLNVLWTRFGELLHQLVSPVVMGVVFFLVVTPVALIMRTLGTDPLRLKRDADAETYWIERQPSGPDPRTMARQY
jgi:Saxitoxin biosynthesis operon protein SxtJ